VSTPIEIFRAGKHTASNGVELSFGESDLAASAAAYDPALHEAPIVVGHPTHDGPALGWVKQLAFGSGRLVANAEQLDPAFQESVKAGRYKKVSASFYAPSAPSNPKPGVYYLRHVGFLGAQPPAVKGLKAVNFGEGDPSHYVTFEFGDEGDRMSARLFRMLRDWMLGKFGQEETDKALPAWYVDNAQESAAQPEGNPAFNEPVGGTAQNGNVANAADPVVVPPQQAQENLRQSDEQQAAAKANQTATPGSPGTGSVTPGAQAASDTSPEQLERLQELTQREQRIAEREQQLNAREQASRSSEHKSFCEALVREGRPLPCKVEVLVGLMRTLGGESTVEFGEGETRSALELFKTEVLAKLPKRVEFGELAPGDETVDGVSPEVMAQQIVEYQEAAHKRGHMITTAEAARAVRNGGKS
jgi:hypothetical protein